MQAAVAETLRAAALQQAVADRDPWGRYESGRQAGGARDRRIGVIWHTQGSGKSLTMAFYTGCIMHDLAMANPTVVVLTDATISTTNCSPPSRAAPTCSGRRRSRPRAAPTCEQDSRSNQGSVVFTTIQEFPS